MPRKTDRAMTVAALTLVTAFVFNFTALSPAEAATPAASAAHFSLTLQPLLSPPAPELATVAAVADADTERRAPSGSAVTASGTGGPLLHNWETGAGKSYSIPAWEVPTFLVLLNMFDRVVFESKIKEGKSAYRSTPSTIWEHLHEQNWVWDRDTFVVNQIGHPYQGSAMYTLPRSTGLNFWESWAYSHVGSFLWEMAGETTHPSYNDLITTGNAGSLLGEALFRMAGVVLEDGGARPDLWHEVGAAIISPSLGFNRLVWGERYKSIFPSHHPAIFWSAWAGGSVDTHTSDAGLGERPRHSSGTAHVEVAYGLPGQPGYSYRRPFDYFDFQTSVRGRKGNFMENILLRGMLIGKEYGAGDEYRGIWGVYGSYDYISPYLFHVSTTALSLGTTGQYLVAPEVTLQGSLLGGFGFGASGSHQTVPGENDHEYAGTPQGLAALKLIFGDRVAATLDGRFYHLLGIEREAQGHDSVFVGNAGVTVRICGRHAVGVQYVESLRNTSYVRLPNRHQSEGTVSVVYTYLGDTTFGAVRW